MYASKKADVTGGKVGVMTGVMGNGKGIRLKFLRYFLMVVLMVATATAKS